MMRVSIHKDDRNRGRRAARAARGFTLVEIAIALAVIALLIGSILVPLTTQVERRQVSETEKALEEIREALIGFAVANGYLPCTDKTSGATTGPNDTPNDGVEDVNTATGVCISSAAGNLPWVTLGVAASDAWGNRFRYRVDANYAKRPAPTMPPPPTPFNLTSSAGLAVCTTSAGGCPASSPPRLTSTTVGDGAVAVILSHGRNGNGAVKAGPGTNPPPPASNADELDNIGGSTYVKRTQTGARAGCSDTVAGQPLCEFDDIVIWLDKWTLFKRMIAAGRLP